MESHTGANKGKRCPKYEAIVEEPYEEPEHEVLIDY
jgi:hypothetical protein